MPKQIQTPSFGQILVKAFNLKGRFQPVLDETIVPVVVLEMEPAASPMLRQIATGGIDRVAGGAGNVVVVQLVNPPTSGVLVVIEALWAISATAGDLFGCFLASSPGAGSALGAWRDTRTIFTTGPVLPRALISATVSGTVAAKPRYVADGTRQVTEWIIEPGYQLDCRQSTVNTALSVYFDWYEVPIGGSSP